jgi:hypothetical protein
VTKAGVVYACGDKFAKNIKLSAKNPLPFGFFALPVDLSGKKPVVEEKKAEAKPEDKKVAYEVEPNFANLFGDDNEEEEKKVEVVESNKKPDEKLEVLVEQ